MGEEANGGDHATTAESAAGPRSQAASAGRSASRSAPQTAPAVAGALATQPTGTSAAGGVAGDPSLGGASGAAAVGGSGASGALAAAGAVAAGASAPDASAGSELDYHDPGTDDWTPVAEGDVAAECKMDIGMLQNSGLNGYAWAIFRYGKLCYESGADAPTQVFSATKSLGGIVTATTAYLTKDVAKTGPGTGTFNDYDLASDWGLAQYRPGMQLAYLMSMATGSPGLEWGMRSFAYDTVGSNGLNAMANVANRALAQDSSIGVANMQAATARLFEKLGMKTASWDGVVYGTGSSLTLRDMGKLFQVMIHNGVYNQERLIGTDWVYRMTHPALEDANTSYGEFFWLNHRGNAAGIGGDLSSGSNSPEGDPCAPPAFWQRYPHKVSNAPDCHFMVPGTKCEQKHDTGIFSAQGLGGQFIIGHPGLDMVLTIKNYSGQGGPMGMWNAVRPALVALDPMYKGDEAAFCAAYGSGDYAPDQKVQPTQPPDPP